MSDAFEVVNEADGTVTTVDENGNETGTRPAAPEELVPVTLDELRACAPRP